MGVNDGLGNVQTVCETCGAILSGGIHYVGPPNPSRIHIDYQIGRCKACESRNDIQDGAFRQEVAMLERLHVSYSFDMYNPTRPWCVGAGDGFRASGGRFTTMEEAIAEARKRL